MESVVPDEITHELTQILSNLVLGDNEIRSNAEKAVNERLAQTPELYLLALAQFAIVADTDVMRSFSLVLLRRLLFRSPPSTTSPAKPRSLPLYDVLSSQTITTLERLLLHSLLNEPNPKVRRNTVDTICDVANQSMSRGRPWHSLQSQVFAMIQSPPPTTTTTQTLNRTSAYSIFAGSPNIITDLQPESVCTILRLGLEDQTSDPSSSLSVKHAALRACVAYIENLDSFPGTQGMGAGTTLMIPMLNTLAALAYTLGLISIPPPVPSPSHPSPSPSHPSQTQTHRLPSLTPLTPHQTQTSSIYHHLSLFLAVLTPLCTSHPTLFAPHLQNLMTLLPVLVMPPVVDCGPTPTVGRPFPMRKASASSGGGGGGGGGGLVSSNEGDSPSQNDDAGGEEEEDLTDLQQTLRLTALEFMLALTEARPALVRRVQGWVEVLVRACLEGMGEIEEDEGEEDSNEDGGGDDDEEGESGWRGEDPTSNSSSTETDSPPALYEQSLDRLAVALGGRYVLPPAFQYIPSMLLSYDWRVRHAGLMAIAAVGEGTGKVMVEQLGRVVDLVTPMFRDPHPRVRYAACQCVGQLCTDLEEVIQERYHVQLFGVLIPALEDPEPRVHAHAAAALINFCEGVARDTLVPYLDPIVERLLRLLNPDVSEEGGNTNTNGNGRNGRKGKKKKRYVQEQAITSLAMVADASEGMFAKYYGRIMPLLLDVLRNAEGTEYKRLRVKAMECAGLVAIAVGRDIFRPDATTLVELLVRIQKTPIDPTDTQLGHYLISTWAKVCQAMGPEFEPYLPVVVPALLQTASAKPDVSVYDEDSTNPPSTSSTSTSSTPQSASSPSPSPSFDREGWETITMDGQTLGIRTSALEEKCQAFETLVIYCSTLGARFAPWLLGTLEVTLPGLSFYYHDGVREACAILVPMLLASGKSSSTLTNQMVSATFHHLLTTIRTEQDPSFLASLYKCLNDSLRVIGGPSLLPAEFLEGIVEVTKFQLGVIAERRRGRAERINRAAGGGGGGGGAGGGMELDKEEMALMEEVEDFVLEDMGKMLSVLDGSHPLLIAVSGVRDLGCNVWDSEEEEEEE